MSWPSEEGSRAEPDIAISLGAFGLHELRAPSGNLCIIFVHGVLSDSESAWGEPSWPTLLAEEAGLKHAGIYLFTYRTSFGSRAYSVNDVAAALLEHFELANFWKRQIVFVCHSMGGIVVRRFLVKNQTRLGQKDMKIGLFLVASPSQGARDATLLSAASYLLQHTQAAMLRFSQTNTSLNDLHDDFMTLLHGERPTIVGRELIEDIPITVKRWLGLHRQVVEPFSAASYFREPGCDPLKIPGSDHSTIVKPGNRGALQHQSLVRFLQEFPELIERKAGRRLAAVQPGPAAPDERPETLQGSSKRPKVEPDDGVALAAAVAPDRRFPIELLQPNANIDDVAGAALKLRHGRVLERMIASALVRRHEDPASVIRSAAHQAGSEDDFEAIAPWLRFARGSNAADFATSLYEESYRPNDASKTRMRVRFLGWSGERLFPMVDWNDIWSREKFSFYFARSSLHACWSDQPDHALQALVKNAVEAARHYQSYFNYPINFYDWVSWTKGVPAKNSRIMLTAMVGENAPSELIGALLARMSVDPTNDAVDMLKSLASNEDPHIRRAALDALAFVPAHSQALRRLKRLIFTAGSAHFAIASGVDLEDNAIEELAAMLAGGATGYAGSGAAWALGRLAVQSDVARRHLTVAAVEGSDKLVKMVAIAELAKQDPGEALKLAKIEEPGARGVELFCMHVAKCHSGDASALLAFLRDTGEDEIHLPYLMPHLQLMFRDAVETASERSPFLAHLVGVSDDI